MGECRKVIFAVIQVEERTELRVDVDQFRRLHTTCRDGIEEEDRTEAIFGEEYFRMR